MTKFLNLRSLASAALFCGLTVAASLPSSALTWTIDVHVGGTADTPWTTFGIDTAAGIYTNVFQSPPQNPKDYTTPTGITWGTLFTVAGPNFGAPFADNFVPGNNADFNFDVYPQGNPGALHSFTAFGTLVNVSTPGLSGTVGGGSSNSRWQLLSIKDNTTNTSYTTFSNDPLTGAPSIFLNPVINGKNVYLWMERLRQVPVIGTSSQLNGFIADVPEPGTVALLVGSGIGGSLMLRRRRRA